MYIFTIIALSFVIFSAASTPAPIHTIGYGVYFQELPDVTINQEHFLIDFSIHLNPFSQKDFSLSQDNCSFQFSNAAERNLLVLCLSCQSDLNSFYNHTHDTQIQISMIDDSIRSLITDSSPVKRHGRDIFDFALNLLQKSDDHVQHTSLINLINQNQRKNVIRHNKLISMGNHLTGFINIHNKKLDLMDKKIHLNRKIVKSMSSTLTGIQEKVSKLDGSGNLNTAAIYYLVHYYNFAKNHIAVGYRYNQENLRYHRQLSRSVQLASRGYLPVELVPAHTLTSVLTSLRMHLQSKYSQYELANLQSSYYYKSQIVQPYFINNSVHLITSIPIIKRGTKSMKFFKIRKFPVHLSSGYNVLKLKHDHFAISNDNSQYFQFSNFDDDDCTLHDHEYFCYSPHPLFDVKFPSCLTSIYLMLHDEIPNYCETVYIPNKANLQTEFVKIPPNKLLLSPGFEESFDERCSNKSHVSVHTGINTTAIVTCRCSCTFISQKSKIDCGLLNCNTSPLNHVLYPQNLFALHAWGNSTIYKDVKMMISNHSELVQWPVIDLEHQYYNNVVSASNKLSLDWYNLINKMKRSKTLYATHLQRLQAKYSNSKHRFEILDLIGIIFGGFGIFSVVFCLYLLLKHRNLAALFTLLSGHLPTAKGYTFSNPEIAMEDKFTQALLTVIFMTIASLLAYCIVHIFHCIMHKFRMNNTVVRLEAYPHCTYRQKLFLVISNLTECLPIFVCNINLPPDVQISDTENDQAVEGNIAYLPGLFSDHLAIQWKSFIVNDSNMAQSLPGKLRVPFCQARKCARILSKTYLRQLIIGRNNIFTILKFEKVQNPIHSGLYPSLDVETS